MLKEFKEALKEIFQDVTIWDFIGCVLFIIFMFGSIALIEILL